jgi:hypothetical protein
MSIIRVIAVDPRPRPMQEDIVIYQVPENSRAHQLLVETFTGAKIEFVELGAPVRYLVKEVGRKS